MTQNQKPWVAMMGDLHDALESGGYTGHDLERYLVRILFCLFADHTGIFHRRAFELYLEDRGFVDMVKIGPCLEHLFQVLNTSPEKRQKHLPTELQDFPYVNGELFSERLPLADFSDEARQTLRRCCRFDWSCISPAIFGSLFQAVMEPRERRQIGGHYTSERDILKVIRSLFLDDLRAELERARASKADLRRFHAKLATLRFIDPACGCGNFLVVTYRELRLLELEVLKLLYGRQAELSLEDVNKLSQLDVDQMFGIEIQEWPVRIAEVALWLMDHQMNLQVSEAFGQLYQRLPLRKSPTIVQGNALRLNWRDILPSAKCSYVLGNPPFVGKKEQNAEQKADMELLFGKVKGAGILDYVTGWYRKAAEYIQRTRIVAGFVSTNSISQGEQVGLLWNELFKHYQLGIHFAHRTFAWESEARGKAHVHVVIIGFAAFPADKKTLFDYETPKSDPTAVSATNINPYLADAPNVVILSRSRPINGAPEISYGSMMIDKDRKHGDEAGLILTPSNRATLLTQCPQLEPYIRRLYGGEEFLNGIERWCLWLIDAPPKFLRESALLRARIEGVRKFRESSGREQTRRLAATPTLFGEIRQPATPYLLIPKVSSELRRYIPIGFVEPDVIASGSALIIPNAKIYHFGVLSSAMHNGWMRCVAGRLESRFQYSNAIVYNNFPWPEKTADKHRAAVETAARKVLDIRSEFPDATLADLYDPLSMPARLVKAHAALDRSVDLCYRSAAFPGERQRVEYLFALYEKLTAPLLPAVKPRRGSRG